LNGIFPFVLEAYKSWHAQDFKLSSDSFDIISSQPLIDNKYVVEKESGLSLKATDDMESLIKHMYTLNAGHLFEEVTPEPTTPFQHGDPNTWKYSPRDGDVMNDWAGLNFPVEVWFDLFDLIPANIIAIMVQGIRTQPVGWAAIEYEPEEHQGYLPLIGDIYFIPNPTRGGKITRESSDSLAVPKSTLLGEIWRNRSYQILEH
jgi:hypothetical protein